MLAPKLAVFKSFTTAIPDTIHREQVITVLNWVVTTFPELAPRYAWNQTMFTHHATFIVGFSVAKPHFNIALEKITLDHFAPQINASGDRVTTMLWQVTYGHSVNYSLLQQAIQYNLDTKQTITTFWRPKAN
ncbi:hypothetical protein C5Z25_00600 [Lactobacillus sp. CBA3605]|nr:DUF1801 domain-containing protein [Lactobacillus sp. CBA3605]AVK62464.1 hypothetical protein C5Z25_00600 [Lactobacillus sp. CBA3605]